MTAASPHWPTFIVVCICFSVDKADQSLLPAVYFELCRELGAGPALLSLVTMARGLVQAAVAIFAGPLGNKFSRVKVVGIGWWFPAMPRVAMWCVGGGFSGVFWTGPANV